MIQSLMGNFKDLQAEWYQKIKDSGFNDIEYPNGQIKSINMHKSFEKIDSTLKYYSLCSEFLNSYKFNSDLDKHIWEAYSQSYSRRQIAKILNIGPEKVKYRLNKLKIIMELWRKS